MLLSLVLRLKSFSELMLNSSKGSWVMRMILRSSMFLGCRKAARNL